MSTQTLPAASLRTGNRLPAGRVPLWRSKYLIWNILSSIVRRFAAPQRFFSLFSGRRPVAARRGQTIATIPSPKADPAADGRERRAEKDLGATKLRIAEDFCSRNIAASVIVRYNRPASCRAR